MEYAGKVDLVALVAINTALCSGAAALSSILVAQVFTWKAKRRFSWSIEGDFLFCFFLCFLFISEKKTYGMEL